MGRLFWKTLLGFLLTFIVVSFGVLPAFSLLRHQRSLTDQEVGQRIGPMAVDLCRRIVVEQGPAACDQRLQELTTPQFADRLVVTRAPPSLPSLARDHEPYTRAEAPGGQRYWIIYRRGWGDAWPFPVPLEVFLLGLVGALAFSAVLVAYVVNPIRRIRAGFSELAKGNLGARIAGRLGRRRDEIADLARDFDVMAEQLEQLVAGRDRLLHDVSHELRSPLSRLQLSIALARQDGGRLPSSLDRIEHEAERLNQMVNELLALARVEGGIEHHEEYFDVKGVATSVVEDVRFEASARQIAVSFDCPDQGGADIYSVQGSAELLRRAIENILRNAVKFSSAGQQVCLALAVDPPASQIVAYLTDDGPGVPEHLVSQIFEPFVTSDTARAGVGLGLSIAQRAIKIHGGSITAANRDLGGLAITIRLPMMKPGHESSDASI